MKIAGILLASGRSARLGVPKQLLDWHGKFLINHVIETILGSQLEDLIVVLGCNKSKILPIINQNIRIVDNPQWESGKSESIKAGLSKIDHTYEGVIYFTVDQPFLEKKLIDKIIEKANCTDKAIVATSVNGLMTIPALYKKQIFPELFTLTGDAGGKKLFGKFKDEMHLVEWYDERLNLDIDTVSDYEEALKLS